MQVFGTVVDGNCTDNSDQDLFVDPTSHTSLFDITKIQVELTNLLSINLDVLTSRALPEPGKYPFKLLILKYVKSVCYLNHRPD